jgi:MFS family permease
MLVAVFVMRFGEGLLGGVRTNFFVDTLGLSSGQVLWLEGIRELPGLALVFIAALTMRLPISRVAAASVLVLGIGYALQSTVQSYAGLLTVAVVASFGLHGYQPLHPALGMSLTTRDKAGRVMGLLGSAGALASIAGMGAITLADSLSGTLSLRLPYIVGGGLIILSALLLFRLPTSIGATKTAPPRLLFRRRYWRYYILTFFEGARKLTLSGMGTLVLVQVHGWQVWQVSGLLLISAIVSMLISPLMGYLVDRLGERVTMPIGYLGLAICCALFAVIGDAWVLAGLWLLIKLLQTLGMGLSTYVRRLAPAEEMTPTLSAGVSINHISSVLMPMLFGVIQPLVGFGGLFMLTAGILLASVPFARAMQVQPPQGVAVAAGE